MEIKTMVNDESYEQITLANAVEDFLTKLLKEYPEEYYIEISIGNDDSSKRSTPISKTFRGSKQLME